VAIDGHKKTLEISSRGKTSQRTGGNASPSHRSHTDSVTRHRNDEKEENAITSRELEIDSL